MRARLTMAILVVLLGPLTVAAEKPVWPRKEALHLPAAWKAVAPEERLAAVRVAELDAS